MHRLAQRLDHGGIVGEGIAVGLLVGSPEERGTEGLWRLHQAVGIARDGDAFGMDCGFRLHQLSHGLYYGDHGHCGTMRCSSFIAGADDLVCHEGPYAIVHGHQGIGRIGQREAILHGVETGSTAIGDAVRHAETVVAA